jgi:hypothetical protein
MLDQCIITTYKMFWNMFLVLEYMNILAVGNRKALLITLMSIRKHEL